LRVSELLLQPTRGLLRTMTGNGLVRKANSVRLD
jgi:hypothetical protein